MKRRTHMIAELKAIEDLQIKRATEGLTDHERHALERLIRSAAVRDSDVFERAAAAIHVGRIGARVQLPKKLRRRLEQQAIEYFRTKER